MRKFLYCLPLCMVPFLWAKPRNPLPKTPDQIWQNDLDLDDFSRSVATEFDNFGITNVKKYGAKGNGTDDTAAIQTAFNVSSGTLYFPSGNYLVTSTITITRSSITILGAGKTSKIYTTTQYGLNLFYLNNVSHVKVKDLYFYGNAVGIDTDTPVIGIFVSTATNTEISGCWFENLNYDIELNGGAFSSLNTSGTNIHDNHFMSAIGPNWGGYGILHVFAQGSTIHNNIFSPGPFDRHCVYLSVGSRNAVVSHNVMKGALLGSIASNAGTTGVRCFDNVIDGNIIVGPATSLVNSYGIVLSGGMDNINVTNNTVLDSANVGIYVQSNNSTIVPTNITIHGNNISRSYGSGIETLDCQNCKISNNSMGGNGLDGSVNEIVVANLASVSSGCVVSDNISTSSLRYMVTFGTGTHHNSAYRNTSYTMNTSFGIYSDNGTNFLPYIDDPNLARYPLPITAASTLANSTGTLAFDASYNLYVATGTTVAGQWMKIGPVGTLTNSSSSTANVDVGTSGQYSDIVSLTVPAGSWTLSCVVLYVSNGATVTGVEFGIGTAAGNNGASLTTGSNDINILPPTATSNNGSSLAGIVVNPLVSTTYYLKQFLSYSVATPKVYGILRAIKNTP